MIQSERQKRTTIVVFGIYLMLLAWLILFKFATSSSTIIHMRSLNLIPYHASMNISTGWFFKEIIYNVIVFVPFGVYVTIAKPHWSFLVKCLPAFGLSVLFEVIQYVFAIGASDITDVIGNTAGGVIGVVVGILLHKLFKKKTVGIVNGIGMVIEGVAILFMGFLLIMNN